MTDEYDPFVDAEIEERRLRRKGRLTGAELEQAAPIIRRMRDTQTYWVEVGSRVAVRTESHQRDMRWWHGLWTRSYASRIG